MAFPKLLRLGAAAALAFPLVACEDEPTGPALCVAIVDHTIGETASGTLSAGDCQLIDGSFVDFYEVVVSPTSASVRFDLTSETFDPFLFFLQGGGFDGPLAAATVDTFFGNASLHILMAPDTYVVGANAFFPGQTGPYALSSVSVSDQAANCQEIWTTRGVTTLQSISDTDCAQTTVDGTKYSDEYLVIVSRGESITITMQSTNVNSFLVLLNSRNELVTENDDYGVGQDARIVYSAADDDLFVIVATTLESDTTGAYGLTVNIN